MREQKVSRKGANHNFGYAPEVVGSATIHASQGLVESKPTTNIEHDTGDPDLRSTGRSIEHAPDLRCAGVHLLDLVELIQNPL